MFVTRNDPKTYCRIFYIDNCFDICHGKIHDWTLLVFNIQYFMIFQYEIIVCTYLISLCVIVFIFAVLLFCQNISLLIYTGELGYDGPLYNGFLAMTDDMLGPSPMHINYMYWTMRRTDSV